MMRLTTSTPSAAIVRRAGSLWGATPATLAVMSTGTGAAGSYLDLVEATRASSLTELEAEALAVRVAQMNRCHYCLVAHAARSLVDGASPTEIDNWRQGRAADARLSALLSLASAIVDERGAISDAALARAVDQLGERTVVDVVASVAESTLGNYINNLAGTPPEESLLRYTRKRGLVLELVTS
jgi:AhpD family alkylhydroperoxidase